MMNQEKSNQPQPQSNKTVIIVVLIIILVLAAVFAGYFIWKHYSSSSGKTTATISSSTPTATSTTTVTQTTTSTTTATTTTTSSSGSKTTISTDYVIADSNSRVISEKELYNLTPWQLKVARNEIYARHGRPFVHKDLQCYFAAKSWYSVNPNFSESSLSIIENKNIATILEYEKKTNSPLLQKDSGC